MKNKTRQALSWMGGIVATTAMAIAGLTVTQAAAAGNIFKFDLVRSPALSTSPDCVANATGSASIVQTGPVEILNVTVKGLPPKTDFDFFVIQVPNKPFGMSWYQGDIETNRKGIGHGKFIGRFSIETFWLLRA